MSESLAPRASSEAPSPSRTSLSKQAADGDGDKQPAKAAPYTLTAEQEAQVAAGEQKYHKLGWQKLTICLIVEAVALGTLSMPKVFATLGMVAGMIITVGIGIVAIYTSWIVGQVKLKFPHIQHYTDAGTLMFGKVGFWIFSFMFVAQLTLSTGSHALTGTIAFESLANNPGVCSLVFGVVSAIILFLCALPPTFSEMAILGYIDFASIVVAVFVTIVATGVQASDAPGGLSAVNWSAWPKPGVTFSEAFVQVSNVVFAYSFAFCQFSFMDEMAKPEDYTKSIWALGIFEIIIYSLSGSLIYAFVGLDVQSPALLSAGATVSRVVFGLALPVIFISGSINTTVAARFIHSRVFANDLARYINNAKGWTTWALLVALITVVAWIVAEAIPFFSDLLATMSSLFISGFSFYLPAVMWFMLLKEGRWNATRKNVVLSLVNAAVFIIGVVILGCGTYASVKDIIDSYNSGSVRSAFTCATI
ncbi:uncharacterized protein PFL1_01498 [Pseudozyma flocculosa PF-1]|nr:uncharacterized protein PFL1_01498 [Pseudozyma flocculosa PF-1]EPQ31313.1 hypothetical protein PFL1_01498 [Pseudozyma flocculosa PF-1]